MSVLSCFYFCIKGNTIPFVAMQHFELKKHKFRSISICVNISFFVLIKQQNAKETSGIFSIKLAKIIKSVSNRWYVLIPNYRFVAGGGCSKAS